MGRTGSTVTSAGLILGGTFTVLTVASSGAEASQSQRDRARPRRGHPDGHVPGAHAARALDGDPARPLELVAVGDGATPYGCRERRESHPLDPAPARGGTS